MLLLCFVTQRGMRVTPLGSLGTKNLNLEKTTSSVLSVLLLIYEFDALYVEYFYTMLSSSSNSLIVALQEAIFSS